MPSVRYKSIATASVINDLYGQFSPIDPLENSLVFFSDSDNNDHTTVLQKDNTLKEVYLL